MAAVRCRSCQLDGVIASGEKSDDTGEGVMDHATADTQWILQGGMLVVAMSAGFALLEVGSVSVRNTQVRAHRSSLAS